MPEKWERWEPIASLQKEYFLDALSDGKNGLQIILSDKDGSSKVRILFEDGVDSYRQIDESNRLRSICYLDGKYGTSFYSEWTFFKVSNSSYINWLWEESSKTMDRDSCLHFCIITSDPIIDVVASYDPVVECIQNKELE